MAQQVLIQPEGSLPTGKISYKQFLEWLGEGTRAEWALV